MSASSKLETMEHGFGRDTVGLNIIGRAWAALARVKTTTMAINTTRKVIIILVLEAI